MNRKYAHISVDDVTFVFQRLSANGYDSIYDDKLFRYLRILHRLFGLKITLYIFAKYGEWSIETMPDVYKHEFSLASDWLKLGLHAISEKQKQNNILNEFENQYLQSKQQVLHFVSQKSLTQIIRLHYWFYPQIYLDVLSKEGVRTILTKEKQNIKTNLDIWETNIRIESCSIGAVVRKFFSHSDKQPLVIFTHEWALNQRTQFKMLIVVLMVKLRGY